MRRAGGHEGTVPRWRGWGRGSPPRPAQESRSRLPQGGASPATELGWDSVCWPRLWQLQASCWGVTVTQVALQAQQLETESNENSTSGSRRLPELSPRACSQWPGVTFCLVPSSISLDARAREVHLQTTATFWKKFHLFTTLPLTL